MENKSFALQNIDSLHDNPRVETYEITFDNATQEKLWHVSLGKIYSKISKF